MLAMTSVKLFTVTNVVIVCNTGEGININTNKINNHIMVSPYFKHRLLDLTFIQVLSIKLLHLGSSGFMALIST